MYEELTKWSAVSQIWFVHDYVQLVFHDDHRINIYNPYTVEMGGKKFPSGSAGYADALVELIGKKVESVDYEPGSHLKMSFSDEMAVSINLDKDVGEIAEAYELCLEDGPHVELNA